MRWQQRLLIGIEGLCLAEMLVGILPFGFILFSTGPRLANAGLAFVSALIDGCPALAAWALLCMPLLILRGKSHRPADAARLAAWGFVLGAAGFLLIFLGLAAIERHRGTTGGLFDSRAVFLTIYSGAVCALAMYLYLKLMVRQTLKDMRAAAGLGRL